MRLITWNVNGIKPLVHYHPWNQKRTYEGIMEDLGGDIICIQETKITRAQMVKEMACMTAFDSFYSFYRRSVKGVHGTAIFTKRETLVPLKAEEGIGSSLLPSDMALPNRIGGYPLSSEVDMDYATMKDLDLEGRTTIVDCGLFVLINLYLPNLTNAERLVFKNQFNTMVDRRVRNLIKAGREVIVVGDLNICADDLDASEPQKRARDNGLENFLDYPPRAWLHEFVGPDGPMIDITRKFHPNRRGMFTCWDTKTEARKTNFGNRLDYILITPALLPWVKDSNIQPDVVGSDHCPVYVDFHDQIEDPERGPLVLKDLLNPGHQPGQSPPDPPAFAARFFDEFSGKQQTLQSWFGKKSQAPVVKPSPSPSPALATEAVAPPAPSSSSRAASSSQEAAPLSSTGATKKTKERSQTPVETKKAGQQDLTSFFKPPPKPDRPKKKRKKSKTGSPPASASATGKTSRSSSRPKPSPSPTLSTSRDEKDREVLVLDDDDDDNNDDVAKKEVDEDQLEAEARASAAAEPSSPMNGASASKWSEIFAARPTPLCEGHNEPSRLWTVNKPGVNKGRVFYLCARPVGPGYDQGQAKIHVDPQYRCNFFQWDTNVKRPAGMVLSSAAKRQKK
ncbi:hypothetical protein JCM8115_004508 [Rhodotorula mucilaginosa]|nr:hypothetical protein B0A53_04145 [Rhodotorula sp. CCFEE 5036]